MKFPIRHASHVKETQSFRRLDQCTPANWIVRHASERDYGIDCLIEPIDSEGGPVRGDLFAVQLKGTDQVFDSGAGDAATRFRGVDVKTVNYWMGLPVPVFFCVAEINSNSLFFAPVKAQVRRRYAELETQQSFGFDLFRTHNLAAPRGVELLLALYGRECRFPRFANALTDLLANRQNYMSFIEEHVDRDYFMEVETADVVTDWRLFFNVLEVCGYAGSTRHIPLLVTYFAEDRLAFPKSWALLHEATQTKLLRTLAPAFAEALRLGYRIITDIERTFWESTDPMLVRYASETGTSWLDEIDRRVTACS